MHTASPCGESRIDSRAFRLYCAKIVGGIRFLAGRWQRCLHEMETGFWSAAAEWIANRRGVSTLMTLTGRSTWVLGSIAVATIASAGNDLSPTRLWVLAVLAVVYVVLHVLAYALGMCWPERFHYGAHELMRQHEIDIRTVSPESNAPDGDTQAPAERDS
jgi:DMSO/TMAO reductase YedYZ heme-binding membrane subunit